jgi:hypothetical protein
MKKVKIKRTLNTDGEVKNVYQILAAKSQKCNLGDSGRWVNSVKTSFRTQSLKVQSD